MWMSLHCLFGLILRSLNLTADFGILAHLSTVWDIVEFSSGTLVETHVRLWVYFSQEKRETVDHPNLYMSLHCIFPSYFHFTLSVSFLRHHPAIYHSCHFSLPLQSFSLTFLFFCLTTLGSPQPGQEW